MNELAEIPHRRLGRTDLMVPAIGLGGAGLTGDNNEADSIATVEAALSRGVDYIDTSPLYGDSERRVGLALRGVGRNTYLLSTKTGTHPDRWKDYSGGATRWSVENSLRLLGVEYVDLLLIHDPDDIAPALAPGGALDTLEAMREEGLLRFIGLGQRRHDFHRQAIATNRFDVILTFNDYHPTRTTAQTNGLLDEAAAHDIGVLNGSPLGFGLLNDNADPLIINERMKQPDRDARAAHRLWEWCNQNGVSLHTLIFQFILRQPQIHCTLTGAKTPAELHDTLDTAFAPPLPPEIWAALEQLNLTADQT